MKPTVKRAIMKSAIVLSQLFIFFGCWGFDYEIKIPDELNKE